MTLIIYVCVFVWFIIIIIIWYNTFLMMATDLAFRTSYLSVLMRNKGSLMWKLEKLAILLNCGITDDDQDVNSGHKQVHQSLCEMAHLTWLAAFQY